MSNPFSLTFGKKPTEYIIRREVIDSIKGSFFEDPARFQSFLIKGVRGCGKTVLMTALAQEFEKESGWLCIDLNSSQNLLENMSYRLMDAYTSAKGIAERGFDISIGGFGFGVGSKDERDSISRCESILDKLKSQNRKLLITIDEVANDKSMKEFASQFQIWLRRDYPIFLLMTGLHENIAAIQNNPQLTFLLRSPKCTLGALGIAQITRQYEKTLGISQEIALSLAKQTKGYAFAFQALGMLSYNYLAEKRTLDLEALLLTLDEYLDEYVYRKIWSNLTDFERKIMVQIPDDEAIKVQAVREALNITPETFATYRSRLLQKGIITAEQHGYIESVLPRFNAICKYYC